MEIFEITGGRQLDGEIAVHGAKNSALPILTAALLADTPSVIHNCPKLTDIDNAINILVHLGCGVERDGPDIIISPSAADRYDIPSNMMGCMRSSIIFLGAILAKTGRAEMFPPGGCKIGLRPIDLHLSALKELGMKCEQSDELLSCKCNSGLKGTRIKLSFPSVGATENIMLAAATACGDTVIENAAKEPEISDLALFMNKMGAKIYGAGDKRIVIEGVKKLHGAEHRVIPDRIAASTYIAAAGITGGELLVKNIIPLHLMPVIPVFEEMGCSIAVKGNEIIVKAPERLKRVRTVQTMPYPGFPTDSQAIFMAMSCLSDGTSMFVENIFENRFRHVAELKKLGARIRTEGKIAVVEGTDTLFGSKMAAEDLRGGAALVVAALAARGTSEISGIEYVDRGYDRLEKSLSDIGADVKRRTDDDWKEKKF